MTNPSTKLAAYNNIIDADGHTSWSRPRSGKSTLTPSFVIVHCVSGLATMAVSTSNSMAVHRSSLISKPLAPRSLSAVWIRAVRLQVAVGSRIAPPVERSHRREDHRMASSTQQPLVSRLTATLSAVCDFLADPNYRECDVLAVCLRRLQEEVSELGPSSLKRFPRSVRQVTPPPYIHSHFRCQRLRPSRNFSDVVDPWRRKQAARRQHHARIVMDRRRSGFALLGRPL